MHPGSENLQDGCSSIKVSNIWLNSVERKGYHWLYGKISNLSLDHYPKGKHVNDHCYKLMHKYTVSQIYQKPIFFLSDMK